MQFGYSAFDCSWNESGVWNAAESETNKKVEDFVDRLMQKVTDSKSGSGQPAFVKVTSMTPTPTITCTFTATPTSTPTPTVAESILRAAPSVCAIIAGEGQSECSDNDVGGNGGGPKALLRVLCPTSSGVETPPAVAPLENIHSEVYCTSSSASGVAGATLDSDSIEETLLESQRWWAEGVRRLKDEELSANVVAALKAEQMKASWKPQPSDPESLVFRQCNYRDPENPSSKTRSRKKIFDDQHPLVLKWKRETAQAKANPRSSGSRAWRS